MTVKSIRVLSLGKVLGSIYAGLGLLFGAILAIVSLFGAGPTAGGGDVPAAVAILMGGGAVVFLPLAYGLFGFVSGLVVGAIYNFVAGIVGGLELEIG